MPEQKIPPFEPLLPEPPAETSLEDEVRELRRHVAYLEGLRLPQTRDVAPVSDPELIPPLWVHSRRYPAHADRQVIRTLRRMAGIQAPGDFEVLATIPPSMDVIIRHGRGVIDNSVDPWLYGAYAVVGPDDVRKPVPVSDSDQLTVHRAVAWVDDPDSGGTGDHLDEIRAIVPGTPGQGPPAWPQNSIPLATINVPAQATAIEQHMIVNERNLINPILTLLSHTHLLWPQLANQPVPRDREVLVQAANAAFTTNALGANTIYYPQPFPTGCAAVLVTRASLSAPTSFIGVVPFDFRSELFQVRAFQPNGTTLLQNSALLVSYLAVGW